MCLAVEISKQSVEGAACLFLNPGSKMQKESDEERVVKQKGIRTWRFGKFCLLYCKKKRKLALNRTLRVWLSSRFIKKILGVTTELISTQGKPGDGIAPAEMLLV